MFCSRPQEGDTELQMAGKGSASCGEGTRGPSCFCLCLCLCLQGLFSSHWSSPFLHPQSLKEERGRQRGRACQCLASALSLLPEAGKFLGQHWKSVGRHPPSQAVPDTCISRWEVLSTMLLLGSALVLITQGLPQQGFCSVLVYVLIQVAGIWCFVL